MKKVIYLVLAIGILLIPFFSRETVRDERDCGDMYIVDGEVYREINGEPFLINNYEPSLNDLSCDYRNITDALFFIVLPTMIILELAVALFTKNDRMLGLIVLSTTAFYSSIIVFSFFEIGLFLFILATGYKLIEYRNVNRDQWYDYVLPVLQVLTYITLIIYMVISEYIWSIDFKTLGLYMLLPTVGTIEVILMYLKGNEDDAMYAILTVMMMVVAYLLAPIYFIGVFIFISLAGFRFKRHKETDNKFGYGFLAIYTVIFTYLTFVSIGVI